MAQDTWVHFSILDESKCYFKKETVEQDKGDVVAILMMEIISRKN